jgi:hypothetical protein
VLCTWKVEGCSECTERLKGRLHKHCRALLRVVYTKGCIECILKAVLRIVVCIVKVVLRIV